MDGFFEILMVILMVWLFSRGAKGKKKRQPRPPAGDAEGRGDREAVDWDEAIGDVLEGLGLPRPERGAEKPTSRPEQRPGHPTSRPEPSPSRSGAEARRRAEMTRASEVQRADEQREAEGQRRRRPTVERGGWEVRDVRAETAAEAGRRLQRARGSDLSEIAGLAEAAARRRAAASESAASVRATRRAQTAEPGAEVPGAPPQGQARRSTASGLMKLEGLSELERAVIYAEILGPPKALQSDD